MAKKALDGIEAVSKPNVKVNAQGGASSVSANKKFEDYQEDPEALAALEQEDPDTFKALFDDYVKRNKL